MVRERQSGSAFGDGTMNPMIWDLKNQLFDGGRLWRHRSFISVVLRLP